MLMIAIFVAAMIKVVMEKIDSPSWSTYANPIPHGPTIPILLPFSISFLSSTSSKQNIEHLQPIAVFEPDSD